MENNHLFLVSTPLHLIVSLAIIDTNKISSPNLVFIDQVKDKANPYLETLRQWQANPFKSIHVFYRPEKKLLSKLKARKQTFNLLRNIVDELKPDNIYVGNDRRIEFQYCMHHATEVGLSPTGNYMDEGTFTYVGRKASGSFSDRVIDNTFKKLSYGFWWKHPETVGASDWISTVFVSFPDIIHPLLKKKHIVHLTLDYWKSHLLKQYCEKLITKIGKPEHLHDYDLILTLPHESIIKTNPGYRIIIERLIREQVHSGLKVGIKYHPRDTEKDMLKVATLPGVELITQTLPFEALLPMIKSGSKVIGDFSTTLISTRLLRPDVTVEAINHNHGTHKEFIELYEKIGIKIINCK